MNNCSKMKYIIKTFNVETKLAEVVSIILKVSDNFSNVAIEKKYAKCDLLANRLEWAKDIPAS